MTQTTSFDLDAGDIVRLGYTMAGIVSPGDDADSKQYAFGRDLLNVRMKALQNEGLILRTVAPVTFPLVAGQASYALPANTLDVDPGKPFVTSNGGTNVPLDWWSRSMYMALTQPATTGQPTSIYVQKTSTITAFLYPVPDGTWPTMTLPIVSLIWDMSVATDITGLQAKYLATFMMGVGSWLALSHGLLARYQALNGEYETAKNLATNDDTERGSVRFMPDYGEGSYSGGRRIL